MTVSLCLYWMPQCLREVEVLRLRQHCARDCRQEQRGGREEEHPAVTLPAGVSFPRIEQHHHHAPDGVIKEIIYDAPGAEGIAQDRQVSGGIDPESVAQQRTQPGAGQPEQREGGDGDDEEGGERPAAQERPVAGHAVDGFEPRDRVKGKEGAANLKNQQLALEVGHPELDRIAERPQRVEQEGDAKGRGGRGAQPAAHQQQHHQLKDA